MGEFARIERGFGVHETHGILMRPEHSIAACSDNLGWNSLYASVQHELPYEASFDAVEDHLMILHLGGPVGVERRLGSKRERRIVPAGGLFILPGGIDFGVRLEGELDTLHIYLRNQVVREVAAELGQDPDSLDLVPSLGEPDPLAECLALGVRDALSEGDPAARVYVDYLSRVLAARLLRRYSGSRMCLDARCGALSSSQMNVIKDYMQANLSRSLSLSDIASSCDLSPSYFARRVKTTTGVPPHQYLMQLRVEQAKRLLNGTMPIVEVALECGFSHQEHLTSVFRRFTGATPAVYRRAAQV
jgi:AraC family transcriptional regulator